MSHLSYVGLRPAEKRRGRSTHRRTVLVGGAARYIAAGILLQVGSLAHSLAIAVSESVGCQTEPQLLRLFLEDVGLVELDFFFLLFVGFDLAL